MRQEILKNLGYSAESTADSTTVQLIDQAIEEIQSIAEFKYIYAYYDKPLEFMAKNEAYLDYLNKSNGFLLCATTLGIQVDRYTKRLQINNMQYAVIFDATASIYLVRKADEYERNLPYRNISWRFCPGYSGTPLDDNITIAHLLKAEKIGISFTETNLMIPMKSMIGIVKIGGNSRKSCKGCIINDNCNYRKRGTTCYTN